MKVLMVTLHYLNGNGGGVFASRAFANAFASVADSFHLMYPFFESDDILKIDSKTKRIPVPYKKNKIAKFIDILFGRVHRYYDAFEKEICTIKPDVVVFDNSRASYKLIDTAKRNGCKVITIHHNYEYEYNRDNSPWYLKRILLFWTKYYEKEAVQKSDLNLTLTQQDKILLANHYNDGNTENLDVVGTFEYETTVSKLSNLGLRPRRDGLNFVITGNLGARQTEQSLISWFDVYYPILKQNVPGSSLTIAGKNPSALLKHRCLEMGINLIPSPESMDEILSNGDVYICPVSLGGGIKLRVMDGLKCGLPVVSHEVSARGYSDFVEKGVLFVYRDKKSFEECLMKIQKNRCNKIDVVNAYKSLFSFESGKKRIQKILEGFL